MKKRIIASLMTALLGFSMITNAAASVQDEIAYAQMQKAEAQASISAVQSNIYGLEAKKQELENYLTELNNQYDALDAELAQLDADTAAKEEELIQVKAALKAAQLEKQDQYEAMKIRIQYMYERGGNNVLLALLSSKTFGDFLNTAENVMALSRYDRDMLTKFENTCKEVEEKEETVNYEIEDLGRLMAEKEAKQQEVEELAANTSSNIQNYISQISASQEEINYLYAEINQADSTISALYARAEREAAARAEAAYRAQMARQQYWEENYDEDGDYSGGSAYEESYDGDYGYEDSYYEDSYEDFYYEDSYYEDSYEEDYYEESYSSGGGTYLGTFKLTGYCSCASCCGTANNRTASGVYPSSGHTVAMAGVPFGTQLLINGCVYTVEDLGTPYGHVDIYFDSHQSALNFGLQYAEVYRLN